ncbi:MAG: 50S ribosomal protein L7Ae [Candidatus Micrarchaeales archaeon]|nr:50S ribosomal protein L7Ae [Candidatus Micrarchaeales archaeon]
MAKSYVEFKVAPDVVAKTGEALQLAKQSGTIRKGANEVTKSVERGLATLVVIAEDVEPEEVVVHIPKLCAQKKIPYTYMPTKEDVGKAAGMNVPCAAVAIEKQGGAANAIKEVVSKTTGVAPASAPSVKKEEKKATAEPKKEKAAAATAKKE